MSKAVLTAPLERSMCPYQRSLLSGSVDLMVAVSCGFTLQICLIIALSFSCRRWRLGFVNGQVSLAWSIAHRTQELYTRPRVLKKEVAGRENLYHSCCGRKLNNHRLRRACLLGSKKKVTSSSLSGPTWTSFCGLQFPGTVYTYNQGLLSSA